MLFRIFRTRRLPYENKMHAKGTKQVRDSTAVSDCTEISCIRKDGEPRIQKLSAYEIFWIYSSEGNRQNRPKAAPVLLTHLCKSSQKPSETNKISFTPPPNELKFALQLSDQCVSKKPFEAYTASFFEKPHPPKLILDGENEDILLQIQEEQRQFPLIPKKLILFASSGFCKLL